MSEPDASEPSPPPPVRVHSDRELPTRKTTMPTYEYICDAGHENEKRQSINADPLERCPVEDCDAPAKRKISMGAGLISGKGKSGRTAGGSGGAACGPGGFT